MKKRYIIPALLISIFFGVYNNVQVNVGPVPVTAQSIQTQTAQAPENVKQTPDLVNIAPAEVNSVSTPTPKPTSRWTEPTTGEFGTPIPSVEAIPYSEDFKRSDGFDNVCVTMPDGTWTTAIMSGYSIGPDLYLYKGEIDPATEAPATAVESRAWCTQHAPVDNN